MDRIRLPVADLARRIGRDKMTAHRALDESRNTGRRVLAEVEAALDAEERALFDWLLALHPDWGGGFTGGCAARPGSGEALSPGASPG